MRQLWERLHAGLVMAAASVLAVLCCLVMYQVDNKYTAAGPQGSDGVLTVTAADLADHPVIPLVAGWEYYRDKLLTPQDFTVDGPTPDAITFVGQFDGFDAGNPDSSPHGSATYRLVINLPAQPAQYLLEIPEVYSAYRAWVNSDLVAALGDPDPDQYRPETRIRTVQFGAASQAIILLAVSDFSHVSSGMTHSPLLGLPEALSGLASARLMFHAVITAFAVAVGVFALLVGLPSRRRTLAAPYGLLCLCFTGFTAYPLIKNLTGSFYPFYVIEQLSFSGLLLTAVVLQSRMLGRHVLWDRIFIGFGALTMAASVVAPFAVLSHQQWVMSACSGLVNAFEWATAAFLTARTAAATWQGRSHSLTLTAGVLALDATLVMDRLLSWHEPMVTGRFYELGSFALVVCIGVVVARDLAVTYRENLVLAERMGSLAQLSRLQERNYQLMEARITEAKAARHDLRHHLAAISGLLGAGRLDTLGAYVRRLDTPDPQPIEYSRNQVVNVLLGHFGALAEQAGVSLTVSADVEASLPIPDPDLATVLANLLENALEACSRMPAGGGRISLALTQKPSLLAITMANTAPRPGLGSAKAPGRKGYGLESIRQVAARHGGEAKFAYDEPTGVFHSTVALAFG